MNNIRGYFYFYKCKISTYIFNILYAFNVIILILYGFRTVDFRFL